MGKIYGPLLIIAAGFLWGTTGTSQALGPSTSNPLAIGALRLLFAGAFLLIYAYWRGAWSWRGWPWWQVLLGGALIASYQVTFFSGVGMAGVAIGTIVGLGASPIFAGFFEAVFFRRAPSKIWAISTVVALIGCALLVSAEQGSIEFSAESYWGIFLAIIAGASYAGYSLLLKLLIERKTVEQATALLFSCGAVLLAPILFWVDVEWFYSWSGLLLILHLSIFATSISYLLFARGLELTSLSTAITLGLTEPMVAGFLAFFVLGEKLTMMSGIGLALIFSAVVLLVVPWGDFQKRAASL